MDQLLETNRAVAEKMATAADPELYKANLPYKRIYPIPSSEINANKLMEQNPGNNWWPDSGLSFGGWRENRDKVAFIAILFFCRKIARKLRLRGLLLNIIQLLEGKFTQTFSFKIFTFL